MVVTAIPNVAFVSLCLVLINYLLWKTQLTELVESQDLHGFFNGEIQIPTQLISNLKSIDAGSYIYNLDYMEWKRFYQICMLCLNHKIMICNHCCMICT